MTIKGQGHSLTLVHVHSDLTFSNLFSLETAGPPGKHLKISKRSFTLKLGMQYPINEYYQMYSNEYPGMTLSFFTTKSYLVLYAFVWEKDKDINNILVYDIKVGRCSQSDEYTKLYEYQRSRSFIDLHPRSLRFNIFKLLFLRNS